MKHVEVTATIPGRRADEVYRLLCDFDRYPGQTDAVRSVSIDEATDGASRSTWEVNFRNGILRWSEEDRFDPQTRSIVFEQTAGDVDHFAGSWAVADDDGGCRVSFAADFDMGIPSLSDIIEPIAADALDHNIRSIVSGLVGGDVVFTSNGRDASAGDGDAQ